MYLLYYKYNLFLNEINDINDMKLITKLITKLNTK